MCRAGAVAEVEKGRAIAPLILAANSNQEHQIITVILCVYVCTVGHTTETVSQLLLWCILSWSVICLFAALVTDYDKPTISNIKMVVSWVITSSPSLQSNEASVSPHVNTAGLTLESTGIGILGRDDNMGHYLSWFTSCETQICLSYVVSVCFSPLITYIYLLAFIAKKFDFMNFI